MQKGKYSIDGDVVTYYDMQGNEETKAAFNGDPDEIPTGYIEVTSNSPIRVMRWQFKAQLALESATDNNFTTLKDQVDYIITQMTGSQKIITEEAWVSANTISRISPTVGAIGSIVGLTETQIDNIFISSSLISI